MAVGDGGFKQVAFGFDKNEVNTYISDLRKKMKSMEEYMKANDKKTQEEVKLAEEADERIKAAVKEGEENAAKLERELSAEQDKTARLEADMKKLKSELEDERKKMSDMLLSGKGVSAEANKAYTEIINKANADAKVIIDDANAKAAEITAGADAARAATDGRTAEFLDVVKAQIEALTAGYNEISASASELLGAAPASIAPVNIPAAKPVKAAAAVAAIIAAEEVIEEITAPAPVEEKPAPVIEEAAPAAEPEPETEDIVTEITASESVMEIAASSDAMPAITEEDKAAGDELASFDDVWGGNELAQTIFNNEKKDAVPLVNPDAKNLFGQDLFADSTDSDTELTGAFVQPEPDEPVTEIKPLDVSDIAEASFDNKFDNDLLAQTMPSGALGDDVDESLLEAVKAAEAAFAVQPNNIADLDMDEHDDELESSSEDDLMKALREAEAALNSLAPAESSASDDVEISSDSSSAADPWADLQKQFEAMEQAGSFDVSDPSAAEEPDAPAASEDPAAPSADDAAIWNFGDSSASSDDDDMSGDMFGGFGGF